MRIPSGVTDQYIYFVALDSTDLKTRETGLTTFTVYRSRNGAAAAAMTTPTINETDSTNMPGVYELLLDEDMTIGSDNDSEEVVFHITQADMAPVDRTIELYRLPFSLQVDDRVPDAIDLADTTNFRLGLKLTNQAGDLPTTAEITPGNITIARKAFGATSWSTTQSSTACLELEGLIYFDEVFDSATGYVEGDSIRISFTAGKVTVNGKDYVVSASAASTYYYAYIRQTTTGTPPTAATIADAVWDEAQADHVAAGSFGLIASEIASILVDTNELQADWTNAGRLDAILDLILADTGELQSDDVPGLIAALNDPSAATTAAAVWDAIVGSHVVDDSFGLHCQKQDAGTAAAGANSTITLDSTASSVNDTYNGSIVSIVGGTGVGQARHISDYVGSTLVATVLGDWNTNPDSTSKYVIVPFAAVASHVWDQILTGSTHNINNSAGKRLRQIEQAFVQASGTIATVTNGHTFTLDSGAVATAEYYHGSRLQILEGTGAGQSRIIIGYTSGRVVTLDSDFTTNPDTSSLYEIDVADVHVSVSDSDLAEGFVATATSTTQITLDSGAVATTDYYVGELIVFTHGTGEGQAREITGYTSGRVVTMSPALATAVSTDTVWHVQAAVSVPEIVDEMWNEAISGHTASGSFGEQCGVDIDAILADTNELQSDDVPGLIAALNDLAASDILTTALTEAYAADGSDFTLAQGLFMIYSLVGDFDISGTTLTARKLDGTTAWGTWTLDSATDPTDRTRAT